MPLVTIKASFQAADGQDKEEILTEYFCDSLGCPNVAVHLLGCIKELGVRAVVCEQHLPQSHRRKA